MAVIQGLDIRDSSGTQLDVVTHHYDGEWKQTVNAADMLTVTIPNEYTESVVNDNEIWVRRGDDNELVRKFVICATEVHEGRKAETIVTAYDYSILLGKIAVAEYPETETETVNTSDALSYLMGLATTEYGFSWGTLPVIPGEYADLPYNDLHLKDTNVLAAIHAIRNMIGGMLWVDNDKAMHWYIDRYPTYDGDYALELDVNLIDITRKTDKTTGTEDVTYSVDTVDLSAHDIDYDGMLNIGMKITVPIPNTASTEDLYITEITQSLYDPLAIKIAVNDVLETNGRLRDVLDYFVEDADPNNFDSLQIDNVDTRLTDIEKWLEDVDYTEETFSESVAADITYSETVTTVGLTGEAVGVADETARGDHKHILDTEEVEDLIDDHIDEVTGGLPTSVDEDLSTLMLLYKAKFSSFDSNGNTMQCYFWDYVANGWESTTRTVYKPDELRASYWDGVTITYEDGTEVDYTSSGYDKTYQRKATFDDGGTDFFEIQEITPPYATSPASPLWVFQDRDGNLIDMNNKGRAFAATTDPEEVSGT